MTELVTTRIHDHATRLGLPHLAEHLDLLVDRAEADTMGYRDFVDLLLGEELGLREGRRLKTALKLSGLPHHKTLDEFDFAFQPDLDPRKVRDLAALPFLARHGTATASNVALLGPPGTGKTHIAVALAVAACQAGYSIYFTSLDDCVRQLRAAEAAGRFAKKLQTYLRPSVLVLDEVGYLPCDRASIQGPTWRRDSMCRGRLPPGHARSIRTGLTARASRTAPRTPSSDHLSRYSSSRHSLRRAYRPLQ
jgi:DNA replication protein DnaC